MIPRAHMHKEELLYKIEQAARGQVSALGYDVVELNFSKTKGGLIVRFLVDKPAGGISLEECSMLNERLAEILDKENIFEGSYVLEVSSPGVDRPLKSEKDFLRAYGRRVRVFFEGPIENILEAEGVVDEVKEQVLFLRQGDKVVKIPLNKIKKAKQVIL